MKKRILLGLFCVFALGASQAYARVVIVRNRPRVIRQEVVVVPSVVVPSQAVVTPSFVPAVVVPSFQTFQSFSVCH